MAIDPDKLIRQYLVIPGSSLYTLVSDRVATLRKKKEWTDTQKCVTFAVRGGDTDQHTGIKRLSVQFMCYGGGEEVQSAMSVALALEDRLNGVTMQRVSEGVLMNAAQETEAQPLIDPETKETVVFTTYEIECRAAA